MTNMAMLKIGPRREKISSQFRPPWGQFGLRMRTLGLVTSATWLFNLTLSYLASYQAE